MRFPHTVTRVRPASTVDAKGNTHPDWANATTATTLAWIQPVSSSEQTTNQDRIVARWRLFLPPAADMLATDRITYAGETYFVDGEVQTWDNGNGPHHREAYLRKITGG